MTITGPDKPTDLITLDIGPKHVILMKDPADLAGEMSSAPPRNINSMYWARYHVLEGPERVTRNAEDIRAFLAPFPHGLTDEQVEKLAIVFCQLLSIGNAVGTWFVPLDHAAELFGLEPELIRTRLVGQQLVFHAKISTPSNLVGQLHAYSYDLETGNLERLRTYSPPT